MMSSRNREDISSEKIAGLGHGAFATCEEAIKETIAAEELPSLAVEMVVIDGRVAFERTGCRGISIRLEKRFMTKDEPKHQDFVTDIEPTDGIPIELLGEPQTLELSDRDMEELLDAIANPPPPNEAMLRAMARWREHGSP